MERSRKELGKSRVDAMGQAAWYISRSLAASTMNAPKLRRIVRNPDKRWKTDHRRAPYGVMAPKGKERTLTFKPIYRTGEFGKIRFFDKKTMSWFRHSDTKKGQWEHIPSGQVEGLSPDAAVPGIMTDKRRVIGRRGLAKQSWYGLQKRAKHGGVVNVAGSGNVASATWSPLKTTLRLRNELRYIRKAIKGGESTLSTVVERASNAMRIAVDKRLKAMRKA
jgi:hypothetical protein